VEIQLEVNYAGFWIRFVAYIIDKIIVSIVEMILMIPIILFIGIAIPFIHDNPEVEHFTSVSATFANNFGGTPEIGLAFTLVILFIVTSAVEWLYFALMESSKKQATLGKAAVGIIVTDQNFNRISFGRATARYFSKWISGLILDLGYIIAAFTRKKQALHDFIAETVVIYE
jgi:uncharacterized RDD family membrane protein YckC